MAENTLGAPTEGLGQTVTFAANANPRQSQLRAARRSGPNNGMQGDGRASNTARPIDIPDHKPDPTMAILHRLGKEVLAPKIEAARQKAFVSGMQRVATGEAVAEIVNEQPWYAGVFGDTPVVEGARAFASFTHSQKTSMDIEQQMPELRKMSPTQFQNYMGEKMGSLSTGDPGTDALVTQSFMKEMPGILKAHAKEHIGWQQANFAKSVQEGQITAASRYAAQASRHDSLSNAERLLENDDPGAFNDAGDLLESKIAFAESFRNPGMPEAAYQKMTTSNIMAIMSNGNLHAFNTLDDAGVLQTLGGDNEKRIRDYADRTEAKMKANMPAPMVTALANIRVIASRGDQLEDMPELKKQVAEFNASWQRLTGARDPFIKGETAAQFQASLMEGILDSERKALEAGQKAAKAAQGSEQKALETATELHHVTNLLLGGNTVGGQSADVVRNAWAELSQDPAKARQARINQAQSGVPTYDLVEKANIVGRMNQALVGNDPDQFDSVYRNNFLPLIKDDGTEDVALAYLDNGSGAGEDLQGIVRRYHMLVKQGDSPQQILAAFLVAKNDPVRKPEPSVGVANIMKVLEDETSGISGWWSGQTLNPRFLRGISEQLAPSIVGDNPADAKAAFTIAKANGLRIAGGYYWNDAKGGNFFESAREVANVTGVDFTAEQMPGFFEDYMETRAALLGLQPDSMTVVGGMKDGKPVLHMVGRRKDDTPYLGTVTAAEYGNNIIALRDSKRNPVLIPEGEAVDRPNVPFPVFTADDLKFGPTNTMGPRADAPAGSYTARRAAKNAAAPGLPSFDTIFGR
jgi:hypothetical protein